MQFHGYVRQWLAKNTLLSPCGDILALGTHWITWHKLLPLLLSAHLPQHPLCLSEHSTRCPTITHRDSNVSTETRNAESKKQDISCTTCKKGLVRGLASETSPSPRATSPARKYELLRKEPPLHLQAVSPCTPDCNCQLFVASLDIVHTSWPHQPPNVSCHR